MYRLTIILLTSSFLIINGYGKMMVTSYDIDTTKRLKPSQIQQSNIIAKSQNEKLNVLGFWFVNNTLTQDEDLVVLRMAFNNFLYDPSDGLITIDEINLDVDILPEMKGKPLVYPNPLRFSEGGALQYHLTMPMDIELRMYDIFGRQIFTKTCPSSSDCGLQGKNEIAVNEALFNGHSLSSGVYFYVFLYDGNVIGRGKMAVVP